MQNLGISINIGSVFDNSGVLGATKAFNKLESQSKSIFKTTLSPKTNLTPLNRLKTALDGIKTKIASINREKLKIEAQAKIDDFKSSLLEKAALGASVAVPIKAAIDFESAMADVNKVVGFDSKDELNAFGSEIRKLAQTIPLVPTELAKITASGGQLGIAKENLMGFTTLVAKMSTAFDMSAEQAGDTMATIMNVYGLGLDQMQGLGDSINHISDNSAAKAKDITEVLSRIGGTAKVMGLSADNAAAMASAFLAMGKAPEVAGTAINSLFTKLLAPEKQTAGFRNALEEIGLSAEELKDSIQKNPQKGIEDFLQTLSKVEKSEQMGVLSDLFGAEFGDDMALLVSGIKNYKKSVDLVNDKAKEGSMDREFEARAATTANTLTLLKSSLINLGIAIGSVLLPPLNSCIQFLNPIINGLATLSERFPFVTKVVVGVAAGFTTLVIGSAAVGFAWNLLQLQALKAIGGLVALQGKIAATIAWLKAKNVALMLTNARLFATTLATKLYGIATLGLGKALAFGATAIKGVGAALAFVGRAMLANPIGLIITGIAFSAFMLVKYWTPIKELFMKIWEGITIEATVAWESLKNIFKDLLGTIMRGFGVGLDYLSSFWEKIKIGALTAWEGLKSIFKYSPFNIILMGLDSILSGLSAFWNKVKGITISSLNFIKDLFSWSPLEMLIGIFGKVTEFFVGLFAQWINLFQGVFEKIGSVVNGIKGFFGFGDKKEKESPSKTTLNASITDAEIISQTALKPAKVTAASIKPVQSPQKTGQNVNVAFTGGITVQATDGKIPENSQLRRDIQREVEIAMKKSQDSNKNRTLNDIDF